MINLQGANAYFKTRTNGHLWAEYSGEQKEAAIANARRDLAKAIRRPMKDNEPPYVEGDTKRDEFAVYEQALYSLLKDVQPEGTGEAVPSLNGDEAKPKIMTAANGFGIYSKEALKWLCDKLTCVTKIGG